jgi:hypothetical protein
MWNWFQLDHDGVQKQDTEELSGSKGGEGIIDQVSYY